MLSVYVCVSQIVLVGPDEIGFNLSTTQKVFRLIVI
jgi:hypothetical protein